MSSTPVTNSRSDKSKTKSKIITLHLQPRLLSRFGPKQESASSSSVSSPANVLEDVTTLNATSSKDESHESTFTPAPALDPSTPSDGAKQKKPSGAGVKRSLGQMTDSMGKPRGKPGPKKKSKLDDGNIDTTPKPTVVPIGTANPKLGPKANTGNINANLRALDRSGAPCRRWEKKGFQLKSFTGIVWELSSWKGGDKSHSNGSDATSKDVSMQDSSDVKPSESDTAIGSNAGDNLDGMEMATPAPSSPAPMIAPTAIAA